MVTAEKKGNKTILVFSGEEATAIGLEKGADYEIVEAKNGIWLMTKAEEANQPERQGEAPAVSEKKETKEPIADELEQKIIGYLKKLSLSERVEGTFENRLSKEEKEKLAEMIESKKIEKFKLNESYKKAVYKLPETGAICFENTEKPFAEFTLEKDGFVIVKNEQRAKALSDEHRDAIKEGKIKGTRAFTGEFYIINTALLEDAQNKVLAQLREQKKAYLSALAKNTGLTKSLVIIAIEFLKEEGQVIEKKKEHYEYIE